jgi:cellulose biosynthesis protein BcsQ
VFTEKGGVGKTSVAAHLAGALIHQGRDAVLVDCDVQKNLSVLLGEGVNVLDKKGHVSTLVVEKQESFDESNYPNYFIIFDCAPNFDKNDPKIFDTVTDTVIPIVLSPLSVLGNAQVIERTITQIRKVNSEMRFHIIINQYEQSKTAANFQNQLLDYIRFWLKKDNFIGDPSVVFYDPTELSIRRSTIMLHWGMFLLHQGKQPQLAFATKVNGATALLSDFLALADSIEDRIMSSL